jgi:folate-dependent phosphoribosylglycinamide formyltransferase PurN
MKLILFSGTHPRHLFVNQEVVKYFEEVLVIVMKRESLLPSPPKNLSLHEKNLFLQHFNNRNDVESSIYGDLDAEQVFKKHEVIYINPDQLNTESMANKVHNFNADFAFIFGVDLILDPVIGKLPKDKINLHLGLSPWYKGGATLYWPFYLLQPQFCGTTFHQITKQADAGEIIHQCVPKLEFGDRIHDVGAKCVKKAVDDLPLIFEHWLKEKNFNGNIQKTSGRNWRVVDFHASQLRVIYDLFNDKIVDAYLNGELEQRQPKLFSCVKNN